MRMTIAAAMLLLTAACVPAASPVAAPGSYRPVPIPRSAGTAGLDRVLGHNAAELTRLFGRPDADLTEGPARKMQFGSQICVLDAYLYPSKKGEAVVTHIDTRQRDGRAIDGPSCVAALTRKGGGR